jgi:chemotaxis family two-component system response regulator Rcp1
MNNTLVERPFEILLVEDSAMDTLLVKRALAKEGLLKNLVGVTDGEQAMSHLHRNAAGPERPDLILLDLNLPKKDGREVLVECKGDPILNTIPIVVFTTTQSNSEIQLCYDLGADSVVVKPQELNPFLETVRSIEGYWRRTTQKESEASESRIAGVEEPAGYSDQLLLHPLVLATVKALQQKTAEEPFGRVWSSQANCLDMSISPKSIGRAGKVMDMLLKSLEARGFRVQVLPRPFGRDWYTCANVFGEAVEFKMEESSKRLHHQRLEGQDEGIYDVWDYKPTGQLNLIITSHRRPGLKSTWVDLRKNPIEDQLDSFMDGLLWAAMAAKQDGAD